ncbi:MAG: lycopene cyclase domain-containing protein [Lutibacter sp.]|uniref:lycopene cyclase domain-containing protein n=1 Tax=Lutibacter sp. TaxID=1925666 RepID=UPI00299E5027|nr:lycopene cyclase domain-containing protein [Lutibacter sp.]MDX1828434.1 lycopene cyclase domain-containing protein [Lutibacter sp.]
MYLYLILNIASFIVPFIYSFEKKMRFIKWWKSVFLSIVIVGVFFIIWDIIFTKQGVWGFNPRYHLGISIFGLPFEEVLFFICVPYASIFMHYAFLYFFPTIKLSNQKTKAIIFLLISISIFALIFAWPKKYTSVNFILFLVLLIYSLLFKNRILNQFFITFLLILIPFFIVNGILTGSFIEHEVVWYNNNENLGIRVFTIPIEDIVYAFNMLYSSLILIEFFKIKFISKRQIILK